MTEDDAERQFRMLTKEYKTDNMPNGIIVAKQMADLLIARLDHFWLIKEKIKEMAEDL